MSESTDASQVTGKYRALLLGGVVIGIAILAGLVVFWPRSACEGIFEQTAPRLQANLEIIRNKGVLAVGQEKIQELTESAQKVGLHLKTCCSVLAGGKLNPSQFQQCVDSAAGYEHQVAKVAQQVNEVGKTSTADSPQARAAIVSAISAATRGAENLAQQMTQLKPADTAVAAAPATAAQSTDINPGKSVSASILDSLDQDWYRFKASSAALRVRMDNDSTTLAPQLVIYDENRSRLVNPYNGTNGASIDSNLNATPGKIYYIQVVPYGDTSVPGKYRLSVTDRQ